MLRGVEEVVGLGGLEDAAGVHEPDAVGDFAREAHLVGDAHHRHAVAGQAAHDGQHLADHLGIERAGRLVEQHRGRLHRERARDRHALLLAAGKLRRIRARPCPPSPTRSSSAMRLVARLARFTPLHLDRRQHHVVQRGQVREQVEALEHEADAAAQAVQLGACSSAHGRSCRRTASVARLDLLQPVDGADQRRLARARRAADHDDLALLDLGVDVDERVVVAVPLVHVARSRSWARRFRGGGDLVMARPSELAASD